MRNDPLQVGLPLRGADIVFAVDSEAVPPAGSPFTADRRYLVSGFLRPAGSRIVRASLSLPDDVPWPTEQFVYRLSGSVRLLVTDPMGRAESHWTVQANALIRLNGIEAERTGLWRPDVALDEAVGRSQPPKDMEPESAPSRGAEPRRSAAAEALRQELRHVAARSATATWKELATSAGLDLTHLSEPRCRELLVEVDRPYRPDVPLLSVLVRDRSRRPLSDLGTVLRMLGVQAPTSDRALNRWIVQEIERTHRAHEPKRTPVSQTALRPTPSEADLGSAQRQATRLRSKVSEAALFLERTTGRRAERLRNSVSEADSHLEKYGAASASGRSLRK
ncbi:hypothetical protein [Streptomyces cacaoi]|uniref:hypothetical protein n=1 Tax=Streptomyces cacaoi TaxID=1898 RepID=UPI0011F1E723|nr:hypothetical protein [Streptomyces cacaoi]